MAAANTNTHKLVRSLYDQLRGTFGQDTGSIFQMEMPARLLEQGNFQYTGSDTINAQQVKPPAVAEAEFRLADNMLNVSGLVGGPNGSRLSESYREVLFSLVPSNEETASELSSMVPDQEKIFQWLYEEVENFDPPAQDLLSMIPEDKDLPRKPVKPAENLPETTKKLRDTTRTPRIPRIDLYQKLLDIYEAERLRWVQFKNLARPDVGAEQAKWDAYDRLLTTYAPVVDAKLEALWLVLLVRGQYHRVRKYASYIDVETASETLLRAKESLRASVVRSIDDTEDIYPIVMTPSSWAKYLSTNFTPEDLLNNEGQIREKMLDAEKERATLISRKQILEGGKQDISRLENEATSAGTALRTQQARMRENFSDAATNIINLYFEVATKAVQDKVKGVEALTDNNKNELNGALEKAALPGLSADQWKTVRDIQKGTIDAQLKSEDAGAAFSRAQMAAAQARGNDPSNAIQLLGERIQSLTLDIDYYTKILATSKNPLGVAITPLKETRATDGGEGTTIAAGDSEPAPEATPGYNGVPETAPLPPAMPEGAGASVWQYFVIDSKTASTNSRALTASSVSHADWSTSLFFGSAGGTSNSEASRSISSFNSDTFEIQIGFHAMKVVIDRPWMNAQLLGQTKEFLHIGANKISVKAPSEVRDDLDRGVPVDAGTTILPSWTTAFVVVKNVHIILTAKGNMSQSDVADMQQQTQNGGGFLCFQTSKSTASSDHRASSSIKSNGKTISIRIPAPQIIGWISQLAPEDQSTKTYRAFGDKEFAVPVKSFPPKPAQPVEQPLPVKEINISREFSRGDLPTPPKSPRNEIVNVRM